MPAGDKMLQDFMRVLARVHSDFGFYVGCQASPEATLGEYSLDVAEREAIARPEKMAELLGERGGLFALPRITITISGKHDWVNRAQMSADEVNPSERERGIGAQVQAIRDAGSREERREAAVRLMGLL